MRETVNERIQWAREAVHGTAVACSTQPMGLDRLTLQPVEPKQRHRSAGTEVPSGESRQKRHSTFDFEGPLCFLTLPWLLSAMLGDATASPYVYTPDPYASDPIKTLTLQTGNEAHAEQADYGVVASVRIRATKEDVAVTGDGFARELALDAVITPAPTLLAKALADPALVKLEIGASVAGLAAVDWEEIEIALGPRWAPHIAGNTSEESFSEHKKVASEPTLTISVVAEDTADDLHEAAQAKAGRYVRVTFESAQEFSVGNTYEAAFLFYCSLEAPQRQDADGVQDAQFVFHPEPKADVGTGSWAQITITNGA